MNRRAFTLLETVLALAVAVVLLAAVFSFLHTLSKRRTQMVDAAVRQRAIGACVDQIDADLSACIAGDAALGAGIRGDAGSLSILARGVLLDRAAAGQPSGAADLQVVSYSFDRQSGQVRATRGAATRPAGPESAGETVAAGIRRLRFRYSDGRSWSSQFDSLAKGRLPVAIEIAVWFGAVDPAEPTGPVELPAPDRIRVVAIPDAVTESGS